MKDTVDRLKSSLARSEETEQRLRAQMDIFNSRSLTEQRESQEKLDSLKKNLSSSNLQNQRVEKDLEAVR